MDRQAFKWFNNDDLKNLKSNLINIRLISGSPVVYHSCWFCSWILHCMGLTMLLVFLMNTMASSSVSTMNMEGAV
jgi:hypothetical protein